MKQMTIFLFIFICLIASCKEEENNIQNGLLLENNQFIGEWDLMKVEGGFSPTEIYESGVITWEFKHTDSLEVSIKISIPKSSKLPIQADTTMVYSYSDAEMHIGNKAFEYQFEGDTLKLFDDLVADGTMIDLIKK